MYRFICKTLIDSLHFNFNNSAHIHKSPFLSSISLLFFSSSSSSSIPKKEKTKIDLADYLINQQHFSPESASEASSLNFFLKDTENSDSVLSFLRESGFSSTHIEKMVAKKPNILLINLHNTLKPKIKIFHEFGFSSSDIVDIISSDPWLLHRSAENQFQRSFLVLKSVLGSNAGVCKAIKVTGWFLKHDLEKTLIPTIDILKNCGVSSSQIVKYVYTYPTFFLYKPEKVRCFVQRVDEIGFDRNSKMHLPAIRTMSSMTKEKWELKLKLFRSLGFSEDNILSMFRSMPPAFTVSERKIQSVVETLLRRRDVDISSIVNNASLFLCSIESNLKPRMRVYDMLKSKNLLRRKTGLATVCKLSKGKFLEKYVLPYQDELGDLSFLTMPQSQ